jgi:hypothetical protein
MMMMMMMNVPVEEKRKIINKNEKRRKVLDEISSSIKLVCLNIERKISILYLFFLRC